MQLKFNTSINCQNCVRMLSAFLNEEPSINHWEVDTDHPNKILTVEGEHLNTQHIKQLVEVAGFEVGEMA